MVRRLVTPLVVVALVVLISAAVSSRLEPAHVLALFRRLGDTSWAVPAFAGVYLGGTTLLVPAVVFNVVSGATWGFAPAVVLNFAIANVVSNLQFLAGRWLGRARVAAWLERRGWTWLVQELDERGALAMLTIRQLPLPFVGVNVAAGASPLSWRQFALGSGAGLVPQVCVYTWFAASIAEGVEGAREAALLRALLAGAAVIALGLGSNLLARSLRRPPGGALEPR